MPIPVLVKEKCVQEPFINSSMLELLVFIFKIKFFQKDVAIFLEKNWFLHNKWSKK